MNNGKRLIPCLTYYICPSIIFFPELLKSKITKQKTIQKSIAKANKKVRKTYNNTTTMVQEKKS